MSKKLTTQEQAERLRSAIADFRCDGMDCPDCIFYIYPDQISFRNAQNDTEKTSCLCVYMACKKTLFQV
jgi:hypothetical protein